MFSVPVIDDEEEEISHISIITEDEFQYNDDYSKVDIYYYLVDRVFCEDNEDELTDFEIELFDGEGKLDILSENNEGDPLYVRNDAVETDYAIYTVDASYEEQVANAVETAKERAARLKRRKG